MARRKPVSIKRTRNYVVEDFPNPPKSQIRTYRSKKLPDGRVLTFAIMKGKGPRGGRTKLLHIKRPKSERGSSNPAAARALKTRKKR